MTTKEKVLIHSLKTLLKAINAYFKAKNVYPMTEKSFDDLRKAESILNGAITLAEEILEEK